MDQSGPDKTIFDIKFQGGRRAKLKEALLVSLRSQCSKYLHFPSVLYFNTIYCSASAQSQYARLSEYHCMYLHKHLLEGLGV